MESGILPFFASGITPCTSTGFPLNEDASPEACESPVRASSSFDPEICNWILPSGTTTVPARVAAESFIVNPFLVMAFCSCFSVAALPGSILTAASPFARLTSTESTPDTDFNDTRTACAQTSQSMPKIEMSIVLISANADATNNNNVENSVSVFFISSPSVNAGTADS